MRALVAFQGARVIPGSFRFRVNKSTPQVQETVRSAFSLTMSGFKLRMIQPVIDTILCQ